MSKKLDLNSDFDRNNAILAGIVFIIAFITYAVTVQRTFSFWDCGEFIACAVGLGIPHPPGTPLFVIIGRVFALIPFVEDISYRINYISVISSALTALFSYLLAVRLIGYFFGEEKNLPLNKFIAYIGGFSGALFVAFGRTNWANSVEAEVYGLALALSVCLVWMTLIYYERRGTSSADKIMILFFYLAALGISIHMTVFLVVPVCAIFFALKDNAEIKDYMMVAGFLIVELALIFLFSVSSIAAADKPFMAVSGLLGVALLVFIYKKINWAVLVAIIQTALVMMSFSLFLKGLFVTIPLLIILAFWSEKNKLGMHWKTAMMVLTVFIIGLSIHLYIPIRSELNPRIDENNPSRDFKTFVDYLDRKQYGQVSMISRMFQRRGELSNQFGRHPHMGYWSYFEEQWSKPGSGFIFTFFALGLVGILATIKFKPDIGMPMLSLILLASVGLILYMNFADGTQYDYRTSDAYLEVRNRDYFFTPAFVFFGIAMGLGISAIMKTVKETFSKSNPGQAKALVVASSVLVLLPGFAFSHNYHASDRSNNYLPYNYAKAILDTCEPNAVLFTSGDNDTFPVWCLQEVYDYRKDVRVVNLSLLNTDWYVAQMKSDLYGVPMSLDSNQIIWYDNDASPLGKQPLKQFVDKPRNRKTYLIPSPHGGRIVKVQDMLVDDIVLESIVKDDSGTGWHFKQPIYFSSMPYAESPLGLSRLARSVGILHKLDSDSIARNIDADAGFDLMMNTYDFTGMESPDVYRDENATGVFLSLGINSIRIVNELVIQGRIDDAKTLGNKIVDSYPEYWQMYMVLADIYEKGGDISTADTLLWRMHDNLVELTASNPENLFYRQDLGLAKSELGNRTSDQLLVEEGILLLWSAYNDNMNSNYAFRKLYSVLAQNGRSADIMQAANKFAQYKMNLNDPILQQLLSLNSRQPVPPPGQ